jgi:pilus assembly protein CpaB
MFLLAAVAFLVAIGVAAFTYQALSNRMKPADDTIQIVVAALPVQVGAKLTATDVRLAAFQKDSVPEGTFRSLSEVIGRGVLVNMVANEAVLVTKLVADGAGGGLMSTIPEGKRAITVKVNDVVGVAGFVVPGSRVDVILSGSPTSAGNIEMAKVILENIQVAAGDQNMLTDDSGRPLNVQSVTVFATPEQAQILSLAQIDGRIQLALRHPLDLAEARPNAVRREQLFLGPGSGSSTAPAPPPASVVRPVVRTAPRQTKPPTASPADAVIAPPSPTEVMASPQTRPKKTFEVFSGNRKETIEFDAGTGIKDSSGK